MCAGEFAAVVVVAELTVFPVTEFAVSAHSVVSSGFEYSLYADPYLFGVNDNWHVR